jgi:hypothetical protein
VRDFTGGGVADPIPAEKVNLEELVHGLEKDLGVPADFFFTLHKEDDWSFVIKLHALFKGTVSHMLERGGITSRLIAATARPKQRPA